MGRVALSRRAERDLRQIGSPQMVTRIGEALAALGEGAPNLEARPLVGSAPWHRLRVGDYRILYRPLTPGEAGEANVVWLVARVVHRRDLQRAVATLG